MILILPLHPQVTSHTKTVTVCKLLNAVATQALFYMLCQQKFSMLLRHFKHLENVSMFVHFPGLFCL